MQPQTKPPVPMVPIPKPAQKQQPKKPLFTLPKEPQKQFPLDKLVQGSEVIGVVNLELAAALVQIGIPLRRDPSHVTRILGGKRITTFNFAGSSTCGWHNTIQLIRGWKNPVEWLSEHPHPAHPWSVHVEAKLNLDAIRAAAESDVPFLVFRPIKGQGYRCFIREGTARIKTARENGWEQL